jgi:hypothetical protein
MAQELYRRLPVRTLVKDDIEYLHAFSGKEAVVRQKVEDHDDGTNPWCHLIDVTL